jgi:putative Mn2+ efflux pump MntP
MVVKLVALVLPLGLDTFAVAAALGLADASPGRRWRLALVFTGFEAGMPLVGLGLGAPLGHAIGGAADYVAIGVLLAFGIYTLVSPEEGEDETLGKLRRMRGFGAIVLGITISLDELAIGFTLGLLRLPVVLVIVLIAVQAFVAAQVGLHLGARLGEGAREGAERLAGVALVGVGIFLLAEKVLG